MQNQIRANKFVDERVSNAANTRNHTRYGVVQTYNPGTNTATVLLSAADSHQIDRIMTDVPCPTYLGIQTVAPEPGRLCLVVFKDGGNDTLGFITHFFNHKYETYDYERQNIADNGVPRFMLGL